MNENAENQEMDYEDTDDDSFEDNFADDMKRHFSEREQDRQEEAAEDKAHMAKFALHTREDGEFKSLKDALEYYGDDLPNDLGPNAPNPANYPADQQEQYEADREAYRESGGQRLAGGLTAFADDPHGEKRNELMLEFEEWTQKEIEAKESGDADGIDRAKHFKKGIAKELRELPEPPAATHVRKIDADQRRDALEMAFSEETAHEDFWQTSRMKHDAAVLAARDIRKGEDNEIILPMETSPGAANFKDAVPKNLLKFELPEDVVAQIRRNVHFRNAADPNEVFRAAWEVLNSSGWASQGKYSPAYEKPKANKKKSPDAGYRKGMSPAEFSAWRERNGARRF